MMMVFQGSQSVIQISRVSELSTCIAEILSKGSISAKEAERLRGRMQWFETFAFGRIAG